MAGFVVGQPLPTDTPECIDVDENQVSCQLEREFSGRNVYLEVSGCGGKVHSVIGTVGFTKSAVGTFVAAADPKAEAYAAAEAFVAAFRGQGFAMVGGGPGPATEASWSSGKGAPIEAAVFVKFQPAMAPQLPTDAYRVGLLLDPNQPCQ